MFNLKETIGVIKWVLWSLEQFADDITNRIPVFFGDEESGRWICEHFFEEGNGKVIALGHFEDLGVIFSVQTLHIHA